MSSINVPTIEMNAPADATNQALLLQLLQIADSCFPSGGFAFSNGLESFAKLGYLKSMASYEEYLECYLEQWAMSELPFLTSAFLASPNVLTLAKEWNAWIILPAQRRSSLAQAQAWSKAMEETFDLQLMSHLRKIFSSEKIPAHFLMFFATSLREVGFTLEMAQTLQLHLILRDQLGAAVRLGLLGSLQAQKLQRKFIQVGERYRIKYHMFDYTQSVRSHPMIEMAQASHPFLYSKLFQS